MTETVVHVGPDGEVSRLPEGERVLWRGAPEQRSLARYFLRERWFYAFVLGSFTLGAAEALQHEVRPLQRLIGVATLSTILAVIAFVTIRWFSWRLGKTSSYVITDRRVYFNIGIVLRADANIPFSSVEGIDLRRRSDGSADLMITLSDAAPEIPWLLLFPHMTWRTSGGRGRPTFRALREPEAAADAIVGALQAYVPSAGAVAPSIGGTAPVSRSSVAAGTPSPA